jgi:O-antigen/teichoic acid export membrane protein
MNSIALIAYKAAADVASKGVMFAITVLAAHRLTRASFGTFAVATTLGWMLTVVADAGIQLHVAREIARRREESVAIVRTWLRVRILITLAVAAGAFAAAALGLFDPYAVPTTVIVCAYLLSGLGEFFYYVFRGLSRTDLESSFVLTQRILMLGAGASVLVLMPRLDLLAFALLVPALIALVLTSQAAARLLRSDAFGAGTSPVPSLPDGRVSAARELVHDVFPIGAGIVLSALYFRIDVFFVQLWNGLEGVALYSAVFRLVDALRLFPAAVLAVTLPALCRARDARPLVQIAGWVTSSAVVASVVLAIAAGWLVPFVYGAAFAEATPAFRVLLASFPLLSLNYALTHQLIAWNAHKPYAAICAAALIVNVALNLALIPGSGIVGAAWATLGTEIFLTAACVAALASSRRGPDQPFALAAARTATVFGGE